MNKLVALILLFGISLKVFSAMNRPKVDTLIYLEIDIRSKSSHPFVMTGVVKACDFLELSKKDGESLIKSFYSQGYFVPDFLIYDDVIKECIRLNADSTLLKYIGQGQKLMNLIAGNGRETRVILSSGENAFIRVTEITGMFLVYSKGDMQLPSISNEISFNEVEKIEKICIPLEITEYKKLPRKCIEEMFK